MPSFESMRASDARARSSSSREAFRVANEARDYTVYTWLMDQALESKARSIFPFVRAGEGDVVVDAGSGTGALAELAARTFHGARVYALDLSHELRARAEEKQALMRLVYGDASELVFPENSVTTKYFSTSGHEVESFGGPGRMRQAMRATFRELKPGGRVIVRDFVRPEYAGKVYMKISSPVGQTRIAPETKPADINYDELSTAALLERFQAEFGNGHEFEYQAVEIDGETYALLDAEWAHEFYLRKDYTGNWRQEIKEKYTYWSLSEARRVLEDAGYVNVQAIPDQNDWIVEHRLRGQVDLFRMQDGRLEPMPFPATHMLVVGEKPATPGTSAATEASLPAADYEALARSIHVDETNRRIEIDSRHFTFLDVPILVGQKKRVFFLAEPPLSLMKCVSPAARNLHTAFVSMFQAIERQGVLRDLDIPHLRIIEVDPHGPPYRYYIQERAAEQARTAADLIGRAALTEADVRQIADLVNRVEKTRAWQLEMNPFSWMVREHDGARTFVYTSGKVYRYDETWSFARVGLWQWLDPAYTEHGTAGIPTRQQRLRMQDAWKKGTGAIGWWKKYLDSALWPAWEEGE